MLTISYNGYVISINEFVFLTALAGCDGLYGLDETVNISGQNEVLAMWDGVRESLHAKGLLTEEPDGTVQIDSGLLKITRICAKPQAYCLYTFPTRPDKKYIGFYHTNGAAVMIEKMATIESTYKLIPVSRLKSVMEAVKNYYSELDYKQPDGKTDCVLSAMELQAIRDGGSVGEGHGDTPEYQLAEDLSVAVKDEESAVSMIRIWTKSKKIEANVVLLGRNYMWRVKREGANSRFEAIGSEQWLDLLEKDNIPLNRFFANRVPEKRSVIGGLL